MDYKDGFHDPRRRPKILRIGRLVLLTLYLGWTISVAWHPTLILHHKTGEVTTQLALTAERYAKLFPYALLQPTLKNRFEYKVVVFDGKATFITNEPSRVSLLFCMY